MPDADASNINKHRTAILFYQRLGVWNKNQGAEGGCLERCVSGTTTVDYSFLNLSRNYSKPRVHIEFVAV